MGNALVAERFRVAGDVFLREAVTTSGAIRLTGANITGTLSCSGAQLNGCDGKGNALIADELKAGGRCISTVGSLLLEQSHWPARISPARSAAMVRT